MRPRIMLQASRVRSVCRRASGGLGTALALFSLLVPSLAVAALSIEPAFVELSLDRGRPAEVITVTNVTDQETRFRAHAVHFVYTPDGNFAMVTNFPSIIGQNAFPSSNTPFGVMLARLFSKGATADVIIQALEKRGVARRLAEPNLTALSGDTASFLAGGEFPFPVAQKEDTITIEWKKFGIGLAFIIAAISAW